MESRCNERAAGLYPRATLGGATIATTPGCLKMSCSPDLSHELQMQVAQCTCGEAAFVFTSPFVSWQQCAYCAQSLLLAWSSYQTPTLVLGEGVRGH